MFGTLFLNPIPSALVGSEIQVFNPSEWGIVAVDRLKNEGILFYAQSWSQPVTRRLCPRKEGSTCEHSHPESGRSTYLPEDVLQGGEITD